MAKKTRRLKTKDEAEFNALDELFLMLSRKIDKVPVGGGKKTAITWGIVAVILIAVASVLFHFKWVGTWIPALIGAPSGVILYMIGLGVVKRTDVGEWSLFEMKESYSFKQRLKRIIVWFGLYALVFIPLGKYIPYGLGGAVLIVLVMTALAVARRTPQELLWAKQGIPDPRDLSEDDEDDYAEEEAVQETTEEADKIYYDEQRGGFGGKLK
jgi:hypothetical protein